MHDPRTHPRARLLGRRQRQLRIRSRSRGETLESVPSHTTAHTGGELVPSLGLRALAKQGAAQLLDIGSGFPSPTDTHHAVHGIDPTATVLYVDSDQFVAAHRRALSRDKRTRAVEADLADTGALTDRVRACDLLDFEEPIVLSIGGWVLEQLPDAAAAVRELSAAIVPGSWLVASHFVTDPNEQLAEHIGAECRLWMPEFHPRSAEAITAIVAGYTLLDPGIIAPQRWAENVTDYPETHCRTAIGRLAMSPHV